MLARSFYLLSGIALAQCQTIVFDGRVPANATAADFDKATSIFDPENVKGQSRFLNLRV